MSSYSWTLPSEGSTAAAAEVLDARRRLFGKDLDWRRGLLSLTGTGDYLTIEGVAALRQSVLRRLGTAVNGWPTRPGYGVGVDEFLEEELTSSKMAELINRIRSSLTQDPRIDEVAAVQVGEDDETIILRISIKAKGQAITFADFRFNEGILL